MAGKRPERSSLIIPEERIEQRILLLRDRKVLLDADLALAASQIHGELFLAVEQLLGKADVHRHILHGAERASRSGDGGSGKSAYAKAVHGFSLQVDLGVGLRFGGGFGLRLGCLGGEWEFDDRQESQRLQGGDGFRIVGLDATHCVNGQNSRGQLHQGRSGRGLELHGEPPFKARGCRGG